MNGIISVNEALKYNYLVPTYQRGYRWSDKQVNELINDLIEYFDSHFDINSNVISIIPEKDKDFYCLQALIVKSFPDDDSRFSVVDGQQRLTTMYILASYLNKEMHTDIELGEIIYESGIEENTAGYLKKLQKLGVNDVIKHENRDIYFITNTYEVFSKTDSKKIDKIKYLIENEQIKFINQLYKYDPNDKNDERSLFESINTGKIPLKDSELIRAKVLLNTLESEKDARARHWDEIEKKLQMDSFWYFIAPKADSNKSEKKGSKSEGKVNKSEARIDFLFEILAYNLAWLENDDNKKTDMLNEINDANGSSEHSIFRFFKKYSYSEDGKTVESEDTFSDVTTTNTFWDKTVELFNIISTWYNNIELYNYMGCVLFMYSAEKNIVNMLITKYLQLEYKAFIVFLKMLILRAFGDVKQANNKKDSNDPCNLKGTWDVSGIWPDTVVQKYTVELENRWAVYKNVLSNTSQSNTSQNDTDEKAKFEYYDYDELFNQNQKDVLGVDDLDVKPTAKVFKSIWYNGRQKAMDSHWSENGRKCNYFLLWSNCELLNKQYRNTKKENNIITGYEMYRFPFDIYKTRQTDIEHVASYKEINGDDDFWNGSTDAAEKRNKWFNIAVGLMTGEEKTEYINEVNKIESRTDLSDVDKDKQKMLSLMSVLGEGVSAADGLELSDQADKDFDNKFMDIQKVGNLTILDGNINRGYQNAPFRIKRSDIITKSLAGVYVYPCTKMVFLKEFDEKTNNLFNWSKLDFLKYRDYIARLFMECFCLKEDASGELSYDRSIILNCVKADILNYKAGE